MKLQSAKKATETVLGGLAAWIALAFMHPLIAFVVIVIPAFIIIAMVSAWKTILAILAFVVAVVLVSIPVRRYLF